MRVLITGATGFIGSHLTEELHKKGYQIRCLIRKTSNLEWIQHLPIEYVEGDYFNFESLQQAVRDVDYIYHSAGVTKAKNKAGTLKATIFPRETFCRQFSIPIKILLDLSISAAVLQLVLA